MSESLRDSPVKSLWTFMELSTYEDGGLTQSGRGKHRNDAVRGISWIVALLALW